MKYLLPFFILTTSTFLFGQNLVRNGSFDLTEDNPFPIENIQQELQLFNTFLSPWKSYKGTPDLMDSRAGSGSFNLNGMPLNYGGIQEPISGAAYAGFLTGGQSVGESEFIEYLGYQLPQPLQIGETYKISFWVSKADNVDEAINHLGLLFLNRSYEGSLNQPELEMPFPNRAHIWTEDVITEEFGWVEISGEFTADSAYTHFVIGKLLDNTQYVSGYGLLNWNYSYYYLDDVCIVPVGGDCSIISLTSQAEYAEKTKVYPNPVSDILYLEGEFATATLYDLTGRIVLETKAQEVAVADLPRGLYVARLRNKNGRILKMEKINKL